MLCRLVITNRSVKPTCVTAWPTPLCLRRLFASTRAQSPQPDVVSLKVGGNDVVDLRITRPTANHAHENQSSNILIHLPPGPVPEGYKISSPLSTALLANAFPKVTIVDVQYRLGPRPQPKHAEAISEHDGDHRFPTPIHDVATAWDYIAEELVKQRTPTDTNGVQHGSQEQSKICLYGSHIGGAMALMLALTNPNSIHAVALQDPIVDWVGLNEVAALAQGQGVSTGKRRTTVTGRKQQETQAAADTARALMRLRTQLFRTPSGYFDEFASPALFLRAPGRDTPWDKTATEVDPEFASHMNVPMRYGEEDDEIGVVECDGGYGPYDDDWHAAETVRTREAEYERKRMVSSTTRSRTSASVVAAGSDGARSTTPSSADVDNGSAGGTTSDSSTPSTPNSAILPRRRKVLRRWPPNAQPYEALLPHVQMFLTRSSLLDGDSSNHEPTEKSSLNLSPVTWMQGMETMDLLRRACFWGREKGLAEERVNSSQISDKDNAAVVHWLKTKFAHS